MENSPRSFRIQKKIGRAFTAAFVTLILLQLCRIFIIRYFPDYAQSVFEKAGEEGYVEMLIQYIGSYVLLATVFMISSLHNRPFWRYFQVGIFLLVGSALLLINPLGDLTGPMFMVTGIIVGYQYGMLRRHILLKLSVLIALAGVCRIASAFLLPTVGFIDVLFTLLSIFLFAYIYFALFQEQIQEQRAREQAIRTQLSESEQYSQLGRNVSAILHNMKNVYFALNHGLEMLHSRTDEELRRVKVDRMELISSLRSATESFSEKIENIVEYTGSSRRVDKERIALRWHTARLVDIFCLDKHFQQNVKVELDIPNETVIVAPPVKLNQVLENLLMNSWEAIWDHRGSGRVVLRAYTDSQGETVFRVEDDGGGIPGFEASGLNGVSVVESDFFSVGKTTKPHGTGHGMAYVIETMRELGGDVIVSSSEDEGTTVELRFPAAPSQQSVSERSSASENL